KLTTYSAPSGPLAGPSMPWVNTPSATWSRTRKSAEAVAHALRLTVSSAMAGRNRAMREMAASSGGQGEECARGIPDCRTRLRRQPWHSAPRHGRGEHGDLFAVVIQLLGADRQRPAGLVGEQVQAQPGLVPAFFHRQLEVEDGMPAPALA